MRHLRDADEQKDTGNAESTKFLRVSLELVEEVRAHDIGQDVHRVPQAPFHSVRPAKNISQNKLPMRSNHTKQTLAFRGRGWDRLCRCPQGGGRRHPAQRRAWSGRAEMRNGHITCVRHASSISICPCGRNLPDTSFVPLYLQACHGRPFPPAVCKQTTRRSTHSSAQ